MVSVCPGGQVQLTCERTSGFILYWSVFVPPLSTTRKRIVPSQGDLLVPEFKIDFTEFSVTRTSESPLISQLLITNVTTEMNRSTIYCSEDDNKNGVPMIELIVTYKGRIISMKDWMIMKKMLLFPSIYSYNYIIDDALHSMDRSLNVSLVNQLLTNNSVTVALQWPREAGAVYSVNVFPVTSHTELTETLILNYNTITINLTISYNIQCNVSIVSSLCGVTTTKVIKYSKYTYISCIGCV